MGMFVLDNLLVALARVLDLALTIYKIGRATSELQSH